MCSYNHLFESQLETIVYVSEVDEFSYRCVAKWASPSGQCYIAFLADIDLLERRMIRLVFKNNVNLGGDVQSLT